MYKHKKAFFSQNVDIMTFGIDVLVGAWLRECQAITLIFLFCQHEGKQHVLKGLYKYWKLKENPNVSPQSILFI